jgi:hypothetical protein
VRTQFGASPGDRACAARLELERGEHPCVVLACSRLRSHDIADHEHAREETESIPSLRIDSDIVA